MFAVNMENNKTEDGGKSNYWLVTFIRINRINEKFEEELVNIKLTQSNWNLKIKGQTINLDEQSS